MTARSDDYIKNMIRRMLEAEGWVRREVVSAPVIVEHRHAATAPAFTPNFDRCNHCGKVHAKTHDCRIATIGPDCQPRVLEGTD